MTTDMYIWVRRFREFQHYRPDRHKAPAWLKDYLRQRDDDRYLDLTFTQRGLLSDLRATFAQTRSNLKADRKRLSQRLGATVYQRDLDALIHAGFIELVSRATLDDRLEHLYTTSSPEVEVEKEEDKTLNPNPVVDVAGQGVENGGPQELPDLHSILKDMPL